MVVTEPVSEPTIWVPTFVEQPVAAHVPSVCTPTQLYVHVEQYCETVYLDWRVTVLGQFFGPEPLSLSLLSVHAPLVTLKELVASGDPL